MSALITESLAEPAPVEPSSALRKKLEALRRKHLRTAVLTGVALLISVALEILALVMFFDWLLELPWAMRLALLIGQAVLWAYITWRFILIPILRKPDDDELALLVEQARPTLRSRLIASIQLTRPGALGCGSSSALVKGMLRETETLSNGIDFPGLVPTDKFSRLATLALFVLGICAFALVYGESTTSDLLKRAFLSNTPVPRKTRVLVQDGDKVIGRGDSVRLAGFAQGIIPKAGKLEVRYPSRRVQEYGLEPDPGNRALFGRTIENVQDSFTYVIRLNDGRSKSCEVKAIPRPTVANIECEQNFPAYTGKAAMKRSLGDLSLLAGSILKLKVTATKDITNASIKLVGQETNAPLVVTSGNLREMTGQFAIPAKGVNGFSIFLRDTEGMDSTDSAVYRVDIIPDKPPVVRITSPDRKEELITRHATMLVGIEATDDFQIAKLRIGYRVHLASPNLEVTNFPALASKLKRPTEPVAQYISEKLSIALRESLRNFSGKSNEVMLLRSAVTDELNSLMKGTSLYETQRFAKVTLGADTKELLLENPQGENLPRLNRCLVRDAFPNEIAIDEGTQKAVELDLTGQNNPPVKRRYEWKIGAFDPLLAEGTKLEFWVEAEDNNNVTGPGIGASEHQYAKIVSESDKRADLLNRAGDYLGSISDVAGDQEKLNLGLGEIIREKSKPQ